MKMNKTKLMNYINYIKAYFSYISHIRPVIESEN